MKRWTLREARKRRGLTQEALEAKSGVAQAVISRIERGHADVRRVPFETVVKLADALDIDPRALTGQRREAVAS